MTRSCVQDDLSEPDLLSQLSLNARAGSVTPTKQQVFYVNGLIIKSGHFRDTLDTEGWQLGPSDMLPLCWLNVLWNVPRETLSLIEIMECNNIDRVMIYQMCVLIIISFRLRILNEVSNIKNNLLKENILRLTPSAPPPPVDSPWSQVPGLCPTVIWGSSPVKLTPAQWFVIRIKDHINTLYNFSKNVITGCSQVLSI